MLIIGFVLIAIAILIFIAMLLASGSSVDLDMGWVSLGQISPFFIYLLGAGTVVLFIMGLELTRSGTSKSLRRRRQVRELRRENKQLAKERAAAPGGTAGSTGGIDGSTPPPAQSDQPGHPGTTGPAGPNDPPPAAR